MPRELLGWLKARAAIDSANIRANSVSDASGPRYVTSGRYEIRFDRMFQQNNASSECLFSSLFFDFFTFSQTREKETERCFSIRFESLDRGSFLGFL